MKIDYGFDHTHKAVPVNLANVTVPIPITWGGKWDIAAQRAMAKQYADICAIISQVRQKNAETLSLDVWIEHGGSS